MTEISKNCRLQAHRGVSTDAPENTLAAFRESVKQGYDLIELDPKYTKDGIIILLHDKTLNKTGRIAGKAFDSPISVSELNFSELSEVEAGSWFSPEFTGEAIPTLAAVLDFGKAFDMEIKIDNCIQSFPSEMLEALKNVVKKHVKPAFSGFACFLTTFFRASSISEGKL